MPVGEMVVVVDRLPFEAEILHRALLRLGTALGAAYVGEDDRRPRRVTGSGGDFAVAGDVLRRFRPFVLHDHQEAEAELRHDLGRVGTDRRGVEAPLGMRDRARADRGARDLEEFALMLEAVVAERLDDDLRRLNKARPRLAHRYPETLVFYTRRAAAKAEEAPTAAHDVEQRDLLGDPHWIVPRQHDNRGAEGDPFGAAGV